MLLKIILPSLERRSHKNWSARHAFPLKLVFQKIHEIQILGDRGQNTRILYVDLKGDESEYKAVTDAKVTM
jgi:hypothetical protein